MEKIKIKLPNLNYKNLDWIKQDNVSSKGRDSKFEDQNTFYRNAGYNEHNTVYYQCFDVDKTFTDFCGTLFRKFTVSVFKQSPGCTLPEHVDTFYKFCSAHHADPNNVIRINVFLEDWASGHYFEIANTPILQWRAGDAILIPYNIKHLSGNMGLTDKYTMQITGLKDEFKGC